MKTPTLDLTPQESTDLCTAITAAARLHGRGFKNAIRSAWYDGGYRREMLDEHAGVLQRLRNSRNGHAWLEAQRSADWVPTKGTAYLMGKYAAEGQKGYPDTNPFGVDTLAKAWRKGYADHRRPTFTESILMSLAH